PEAAAKATLPMLAGAFLDPFLAAAFVVVILSAVLSTVTSAVLSPAGVLAQNVLARPLGKRMSMLKLNRLCVVFVAAASLVTAYLGDSAIELLQAAYEMTLVTLLVPLVLGLYTRPVSGLPALAAMTVGLALWIEHFVAGLVQPYRGWNVWFLAGVAPIGDWNLPAALTMTGCSLAAYLLVDGAMRIAAVRGKR
ncbi:MAG: hypothetical protein WBC44_04540, partial [Planctomycetaceae bacterium]